MARKKSLRDLGDTDLLERLNESKEELFTYSPKFLKRKNKGKINKDSPFGKLTELRFR